MEAAALTHSCGDGPWRPQASAKAAGNDDQEISPGAAASPYRSCLPKASFKRCVLGRGRVGGASSRTVFLPMVSSRTVPLMTSGSSSSSALFSSSSASASKFRDAVSVAASRLPRAIFPSPNTASTLVSALDLFPSTSTDRWKILRVPAFLEPRAMSCNRKKSSNPSVSLRSSAPIAFSASSACLLDTSVPALRKARNAPCSGMTCASSSTPLAERAPLLRVFNVGVRSSTAHSSSKARCNGKMSCPKSSIISTMDRGAFADARRVRENDCDAVGLEGFFCFDTGA
mmetsp:Transcript_10964/g.32380  ORF Transcript_10964/g.32380 Transcript_10964/m.32380 type:complete len:286 (-) Transcript_10964:378-1235(-)